MIYLPEYPLRPNRFPIDKTVIQTRIRLLDVVGNCLPEHLDTLPPDLRTLVHHVSPDAKSEKGTPPASHKSNSYNPTLPTRAIYVQNFHGIKLLAEKDPFAGWTVHTIVFNPCAVCFGHNGQVIQEEHFIHACNALIESVAPLLHDFDDWIHLIPGVHPDSRAWWKLIEIPFHALDYEGAILRAFTNAKHQEINVPPLYSRNGESIAFANSTNDLCVAIYRKDLQLRKKHRKSVSNDQPVLRIETRLSGAKLLQHLPMARWESIDGTPRLVGFRACDLRAAHYAVMSRFSGVYTKIASVDGEDDNKIGRFMAWVSSVSGLSLDTQIEHYTRRFLSGNTPESVRNAKSILRKSARKELALVSPVALSDLFRADAWHYQPAVVCSRLEAMAEARQMGVAIHHAIEVAYGSRSPAVAAAYGSGHSLASTP